MLGIHRLRSIKRWKQCFLSSGKGVGDWKHQSDHVPFAFTGNPHTQLYLYFPKTRDRNLIPVSTQTLGKAPRKCATAHTHYHIKHNVSLKNTTVSGAAHRKELQYISRVGCVEYIVCQGR